jgi:hypothetical protein
VTCYAWATDVELAGLTSGLVLQGDEYDKAGPISGPATAIASVASKLTDTPIIGSLARATEIGARAVGGIASLFGYSNPPVLNDVMPYQPKAFHSFAAVETGVPMDKLTLDPKNEITVDKSVTGAKPDDELVISHFVLVIHFSRVHYGLMLIHRAHNCFFFPSHHEIMRLMQVLVRIMPIIHQPHIVPHYFRSGEVVWFIH